MNLDFIKDLNIDKVRNLAEDAFNQAKPKTDVEARVYEVLSHKNWGASTSLMNEIAQDTFDYERFLIVTKLMWEAIENQRPAAWRVIFKGLTLTEHLVKNGSERCVDDARNHSHLLRSLDKFNYYEGTVDRGLGVREKAKQLVEILGDDDRIREERMKARQLREKFAGRGGSASNSVSGGGGTKYAGYGNSDAAWSTGASKGYGESGIGAGADTANRGYAGRYGDGGIDSTGNRSSKPSATVVSDIPKKTSTPKVKKVKKKEKAPAPAAEVDLFSFDDAPVAAPAQTSAFDAFQTAAPAPAANDDFGDFQEIAPTSAVTFDAFGTSTAPSSQSGGFNVLGSSSSTMNTMHQNQGVLANQQMGSNMNTMNNVFGNMSLQHQQIPTATSSVPTNNAENDDDFGDFADADPSSAKSQEKSSDPLSKLISLDGLTKNVKKEDKVNEPVVVNDAAAQYLQDKKTNPQMGVTKNPMGFQGIDGFTRDLSSKGDHPHIVHHVPVMGSGSGDVGAKNISMMAPQGIGGHMMMGQQPNQIMTGAVAGNSRMTQHQMYQMNVMRQQQMMNATSMQGGNMYSMGIGGQQGMVTAMPGGSNHMMGMSMQNNNVMMPQGMGVGQQGVGQMGSMMGGGMGHMNNTTGNHNTMGGQIHSTMGNMNVMGGQQNQFGQFQ
eukprot:CCRYP_006221-RA/>CCRYP_006221-RA protein AED:0.06 eAED:0.06 QI:211/1/1/1/0.66/0.57/7/1454/662